MCAKEAYRFRQIASEIGRSTELGARLLSVPESGETADNISRCEAVRIINRVCVSRPMCNVVAKIIYHVFRHNDVRRRTRRWYHVVNYSDVDWTGRTRLLRRRVARINVINSNWIVYFCQRSSRTNHTPTWSDIRLAQICNQREIPDDLKLAIIANQRIIGTNDTQLAEYLTSLYNTNLHYFYCSVRWCKIVRFNL